MKIAVIGASPSGIEIATHFTSMGAFVRVFEVREVGGNLHHEVQNLPMDGNWGTITTKLGCEQISFKENLSNIPTTKDYLEKYFLPLARHFSLGKNLMKAKVERVHKRFLSLGEEIPKRSRLADLFRVVYSLEPMVLDEENKEAYQNLEEKLGQKVVDSLKDSMEYYEDFDLVFDCSGRALMNPMGPSQVYAIGEKRLVSHPELIYGLEAYNQHSDRLNNAHEIALVGSGKESAMALIKLQPWLKVSSHFLTIISDENDVFGALESELLKKETKEILAWSEAIYEKDKDEFMAKMEDWKNLDDYVRVKMPKPLEPKKRIALFEACNVTSVDKLIDQPKIFLSLESPDFRKRTLKEDIVTLGFDLVLIMTGRSRDKSLFQGLRLEEPGFYQVGGNALPLSLEQIAVLEKNVLTFFSRA